MEPTLEDLCLKLKPYTASKISDLDEEHSDILRQVKDIIVRYPRVSYHVVSNVFRGIEYGPGTVGCYFVGGYVSSEHVEKCDCAPLPIWKPKVD